MPRTINMHAAKTQLSRLVAGVEAGEEILIARKGVPVARLVPLAPEWETARTTNAVPPISPDILEDWDETDAEIRALFTAHLPDTP